MGVAHPPPLEMCPWRWLLAVPNVPNEHEFGRIGATALSQTGGDYKSTPRTGAARGSTPANAPDRLGATGNKVWPNRVRERLRDHSLCLMLRSR